MKRLALSLVVFTLFGLFAATAVSAQKAPSSSASTASALLTAPLESTEAVAATESATQSATTTEASPAAAVAEEIQRKKDADITETTSVQKSKLVAYLDENPAAPLSWYNFLEHAIREAVRRGMPANILVLILLFPVVSSLIAASRHIIGLRGFGIYIPAVLSVALVSTGILEGFMIFMAIILAALSSKMLLLRFKLPYLPRTALLLWVVSIVILAVFLVAPFINLTSLMSLNIFPILILVLLAENFLDAQGRTKQADAIALTLETLGLAFASGLLLKWELMQRFALTEPELLLSLTFILSLAIGKFTGLRLTEYLRFRSIMEEE